MALPCEIVPFQLSFFTGKNEYALPVVNFYFDVDDIYKASPSVEITELVQIKVLFTSDNLQAKLYIEGMEEIVSKGTEDDDEGVFMSPDMEARILFDFDDYPLIPGFYQIVVDCGNSVYYALLSVKPKHVLEPAWVTMRDELELVLPGMAMDLVFRNLGVCQSPRMKLPLPPYNFFAFLVINKNFSQIMSSLTDLMTKANFRLKKHYVFKRIATGAVVDEFSLTRCLSRPSQSELVMSPIKDLNYDLPENRWAKVIVQFMGKILDDFLIAAQAYGDVVQKDIKDLECYGDSSLKQRQVKGTTLQDLKGFCQRALKIKTAIKILESAHWYQELTPGQCDKPPVALFIDSRYGILYKLYRQIKRYETSVTHDKLYAFQWKSSAKLYELWCFVQIYKSLQNLGFEVRDGWMSAASADGDKVLIPSLPSGAYTAFSQDNIIIRLHYDSFIPYTSDETDQDYKPLYISWIHNRPDIRLDVYIDALYSGSILMDSKYRRPTSFWNSQSLRSHLRPKEMEQLNCYSTQCSSLYLYGDKKNENIRPVPEAWVLYPAQMPSFNNRLYSDQRIRFLHLAPQSENLLEALLHDRINDFLNKAQEQRAYC